MNKLILLCCICCLHLSVFAQSVLNVNRLIVKDSIAINGKWIRQFGNDSTMQRASDQSVSTSAAWKQYIDHNMKVTQPGKTSRTDSMLTLLPATRELALAPVRVAPEFDSRLLLPPLFKLIMRPEEDSMVGFFDPITFNVTSSDGITTPIVVKGNQPDVAFAKGQPPFKLSCSFINNHPGQTIRLSSRVGFQEQVSFAPVYSALATWQQADYLDTIQFTMSNLYGFIRFRMAIKDIDTAPTMRLKIYNRSNYIYYTKSNPNLYLLPGESCNTLYPARISEKFGIAASRMISSIYGFNALYTDEKIQYNVKLYKNGVQISSTSLFESFMLDETWKEAIIICE
ncbi:hypothetical protein [Chitinophaga sp. HK235]|uniref:hypothetical protein n=1 Tax=Chitinophaga sp. HK235 TaxID=2952571 RepID=UPI001BA562E2|nr:hypothetical protein [Chitinophaga sp. HK235]